MAGGIAAWAGFTLPSAAVLLGFGTFATSVDLAEVGWVRGLKLAAVAVVAHAVVGMARSLAPDRRRRAIALAAGAAALVVAGPLTQVGIIGAGAAAGFALVPAGQAAPQPARGPTRATGAVHGITDLALAATGLGLLAWGRVPVVGIVAGFALAGEALSRVA